MEQATDTDKKRISRYLLYFVHTTNIYRFASKILSDPLYMALFNEEELEEIRKSATVEELEIPDLLLKNDWGIPLITYTRQYMCISINYIA